MRVFSYASDRVVWAPAKVNLFLEVLHKRPDGYHDLVTFMLAVNLFDTLVLGSAPAGEITLSCNRADLSTGPDNLIVKAARLFQDETGSTQGAAIRLVKRIPMQAGLGGGSADAAATLIGLNQLWQRGLPQEALAELGARLGSDVTFFLKANAAWCTGRGEIVEPATIGRALHLVLVCPPFGCSTPEVYRGLAGVGETARTPSPLPLSPAAGEREAMRQALKQGDIDAIARALHNRLTISALGLAPKLGEYLEKLRSLGPAGVLLSGSGSSVFALCRGRKEAKDLARAYARGPIDQRDKVFVVRS